MPEHHVMTLMCVMPSMQVLPVLRVVECLEALLRGEASPLECVVFPEPPVQASTSLPPLAVCTV